jgi:hypothetical protein
VLVRPLSRPLSALTHSPAQVGQLLASTEGPSPTAINTSPRNRPSLASCASMASSTAPRASPPGRPRPRAGASRGARSCIESCSVSSGAKGSAFLPALIPARAACIARAAACRARGPSSSSRGPGAGPRPRRGGDRVRCGLRALSSSVTPSWCAISRPRQEAARPPPRGGRGAPRIIASSAFPSISITRSEGSAIFGARVVAP